MSSRREQLKLIPKIDLHLHLEGAISPGCLVDLAKRNRRTSEVPSVTAAESFLKFSTSRQFFDRILAVSSFITSQQDFRLVIDDILTRLHLDGVVYAEITLAPRKFIRQGIPYPDIVAALEQAVRESRKRGGPDARFIMDIVRDLGPERGLETVEVIAQHPSPVVVGVGLGGSEGYPPELSVRPFKRARELGFHLTAHAGEGAGPPSIWGAIQRLGVERIDHGTRATEDPALLEWLAKNRLPLAMCPTSNVRLGVIARLHDHPVYDFYRRGILVTIGTDDPSFFGVSLSREFEKLMEVFHFDTAAVKQFQRNAVSASFLAPEEKRELWERMNERFTTI